MGFMIPRRNITVLPEHLIKRIAVNRKVVPQPAVYRRRPMPVRYKRLYIVKVIPKRFVVGMEYMRAVHVLGPAVRLSYGAVAADMAAFVYN
jgi:hypothetical protein